MKIASLRNLALRNLWLAAVCTVAALAGPLPSALAQSQKVQLGDPALTAGIPGKGPLTMQQIEAWLANPDNHVPLDVELPLGISLGQANVNIPADNPMTRAKIELGRQLYFDRRLSADGTVSCADCHSPDEGYGRRTQFGVGIASQTGNRNSPISYNRIVSGAQFWDGRAESLEAQAVGPIANPIEMGNTHQDAVATIKGVPGYRRQFEKIFDDGVTIDNVGKAIASFERALVTGPSPYDYYEPLRTFTAAFAEDLEDLPRLKEEDRELYDRYMALLKDSNEHPMSESARRGRELFFSDRVGCTACHAGANFTDEKYHNLGVGMDAAEPDLGRYVVTKDDKDRGAFKTPTCRNVALSAPYMHDGSQKTLEEVVAWYSKGGHPNPHLSDKIKKIDLTAQEQADLVAFMKALTGDFPKVERGRLP
jgi:cytochrome c peroxidase